MRQIKYSIILAMISLLVLSISIARADEPEKIEKVIVSGIGIDMDKAKQNAIRNAVEQVIGSYISSDTIVQNSTVLKDEVLNYSGGYVIDMKIISHEKNDDGLYSVKIEANVISTKLKRKLESLNIATKKIEGKSLFGEAVSKIENQMAGQELLDKVLSKYPQAAYTFEIGKPQILSTDPGTGTAKVKIPITIQWDHMYLEELKDVLSKLATSEFKSTDMVALWNGQYRMGHKIACFSSRRTITSGKADVCEAIGIVGQQSKINSSNGNKLSFKPKSILNIGYSGMSLSLKFKDKSGKDVSASTYTFKGEDNDMASKQGISKKGTKLDMLDDGAFNPPNIIFHSEVSGNMLILTDGTFKLNPEVSIDASILKDITKIEVHLNSWEE